MNQTTKRHRKPPRAVATAAAFAGLASAAVMPVSASAIQEAYYAHTKVCVRLLFNDKPAHNRQCLPNNSPNIPAHDGGNGGNLPVVVAPIIAAPVVAPPPPPVPEPDPDVDSSYPGGT